MSREFSFAVRLTLTAIALSGVAADASPEQIPQELRGKWIITRVLPTSTVSCWDDRQARAILNTVIEYTADTLRWNKVTSLGVTAHVRFITADEFHQEYSGYGANGSQVTFKQLGIGASKLEQIKVDHPNLEITGATIEIPGDEVLVENRNKIIFSVCNVYFEADRLAATEGAQSASH